MHNPLPNDATFAFPIQCNLLKVFGAWPLKQSNPPTCFGYTYLSWSYTMIAMIAFTCFVQNAYFIAEWGDVLAVADSGCTVFMGYHILLRLIHLSLKRHKLKQLITDFVKHIWISK